MARSRITYREATPADIEYVALHMRASDRKELLAIYASGADTLGILRQCASLSILLKTAVARDGAAVAIFGLFLPPHLPGAGSPWLMGTERVAEFSAAFLEDSGPYLAQMLAICPYLVGYVDARNLASIRWLRHLGFEVGKPQPLGPESLPFHEFHMWAETPPTRGRLH